MLRSTIPETASMRVIYPYVDCKIFQKGDTVFYRKNEEVLEFWHPQELRWKKSVRENILEDGRVFRL